MKFNTIPEIVGDLKTGKMVIIVDDKSRENEGDLVLPACSVTPEAVNFMIREARGLVCVSLTSEQVKRLGLPLMVNQTENFSPNQTAFTVSVEAVKGISTGISAQDRARTIKTVADPDSTPADIISPGHVFPIRAQDGGVLKRAGHTEAGVDLCHLAGRTPSAVICEITNEEGRMARSAELFAFAKKHNLKIGAIEDLIEYRMAHESLVKEKLRTPFSTGLGANWTARVFYDEVNDREHLALVKGDPDPKKPVLVRVHSSCLSGDLFQDHFLNSGFFLKQALNLINREGRGVLVYLRMQNQISKQLEFHKRQWTQKGPFPFDGRDYGIGAQILKALGLSKIRLITNSSAKKIGLKGYHLSIVETVPVSEPASSLLKIKNFKG